MEIKCESSGFYEIRAIRPDGSERKISFPNLITDIGLERMGWDNQYLSFCRVGSGSSTPQYTDTQLNSQIASRGSPSSTEGASPTPPYYGWARRVYTFPEGAAAGNLTEIGIGWAATGTTLFSRALILDSFGNPTTMTVLPDEVLIVTYEHRYYVPDEDFTGTVNLTGNIGGSHDVIGRASQVTNGAFTRADRAQTFGGISGFWAYTGDIGPVTGVPSGVAITPAFAPAAGSATGTTAVHTTSFGLSQGNNAAGIRSITRVMGNSMFQFQFDPPIPKTSDNTLSITFSLSWGRK